MQRTIAAIAAAACLAGGGFAAAQSPARSVWQGVYSEAQSARGQSLYKSACAQCHGETLEGDLAPTLSGPFWSIWEGRTAADLYKVIRTTMPADAPDSLKPQEYADIVAYLFSANKFPAGQTELSGDPSVLENVRILKDPTP
jgi:mono/diheme cytochrome c family protein